MPERSTDQVGTITPPCWGKIGDYTTFVTAEELLSELCDASASMRLQYRITLEVRISRPEIAFMTIVVFHAQIE